MTPHLSAGERRRPRYTAPANVVHTTVGDLLQGRRSLDSAGQLKLGGEPFVAATRPLWCAGDLSLVQRDCVAIVGTRNVSPEGAVRARRLARELVRAGAVIVSGLAKGVDTEALQEAISAGGRVIAVIGTPIDKAYPIENAELQMTIARDHLLISQFPSGTRTFPSHFPERNRVMATLTDATAIIEAGDTSGTLHQAAECRRLDRWLFIARNVVENPDLQWPRKFTDYARTRTLTSTEDVTAILHTA